MKILIAPFAYKGTLSPLCLARAIAEGVKRAQPDARIVLQPLSDGGDGAIESLHFGLGGSLESVAVTGPLGEQVIAQWLRLPDRAVIELALTSGLNLLRNTSLHPLQAHTEGLGEMVSHCRKQGIDDLVICLGGSASTYGGTAALTALGARFLNRQGKQLGFGGGALDKLDNIEFSGLSDIHSSLQLNLALDVDIPLLGAGGAARIFGPQKGASEDEVEMLEVGLTRLADIFEKLLGYHLRDLPGMGAAGGTAFGLVAGLKAKQNSGFDLIAQMLDLKEKVEDCDLVISAEGRPDMQSLLGKGVGQLARLCRTLNRPLWLIPASVNADLSPSEYGIERLICSSSNKIFASELDVAMAAERVFGT